MVGIGEAIQGIEYMLEDLGIDVSCPEEVKMLVMRDFRSDSLRGQLAEHSFNVYQRVASSVYQNDRCPDIPSRVLGDLGIFPRRADAHGLMYIIVVHLEALVPDNLKPVDDTLGARERIQMRVCS